MSTRRPLSIRDIDAEVKAIAAESDSGRRNGLKLRLYRQLLQDIAAARTTFTRTQMVERATMVLHADTVAPGPTPVRVPPSMVHPIGPEATRIMNSGQERTVG